MEYIKTKYNLSSPSAFVQTEEGQLLLREPRNVIFRGQTIAKFLSEIPADDDKNDIKSGQAFREGENVVYNEHSKEFVSKCYGFVYVDEKLAIHIKLPIVLNKQRTEAFLYLFPHPNGMMPTLEEVKAIAYLTKITHTIEDYSIMNTIRAIDPEELLTSRKPQKILFAKGFDSQDGWIKYYIPMVNPHMKSGAIRDDGSIDYKDREFIWQVEKDTLIAKEVPAREVKNGIDVFGKIIKGRLLKHREYQLGKNIIKSESEPLHHIAAISGRLTMIDNRYEIQQRVLVSSDVDYSTGNIEFQGSVEVKGSIMPGFKVTTSDDLTIHGSIDGGIVHCGKDLYVREGIKGAKQSIIESKGNLTARYVQNALVKVEGDIFVDDSIINSKIMCRGRVHVTSQKSGKILGCEVIGKLGIIVNVAGSPSGSETFLGARMDPELYEQYVFHKEQEKDLKKEKQEIVEDLYHSYGEDFLKDVKTNLIKLPPPRRKKCLDSLNDLNKINVRLKQNQQQTQRLRELLRTPDEVTIDILKEIHPPLKIQMKGFFINIEKRQASACFQVPPNSPEVKVNYQKQISKIRNRSNETK